MLARSETSRRSQYKVGHGSRGQILTISNRKVTEPSARQFLGPGVRFCTKKRCSGDVCEGKGGGGERGTGITVVFMSSMDHGSCLSRIQQKVV